MIYRVSQNEMTPYIYPDAEALPYGKRQFSFLLSAVIEPVKNYVMQHIEFLQWDAKNDTASDTDNIPDLALCAGKLFLNNKSYVLLKDLLAECGEFLPVTFNAGTGYIFNPLLNVEPLKIDMHYDDIAAIYFDEDIKTPIFKTDKNLKSVYITKSLYNQIKLMGLNGLDYYPDYADIYSHSERAQQNLKSKTAHKL